MTYLAVFISNFNVATFKPAFFLFHVFISFILILSHGSIAKADKVTLHMGAIIDFDSRIGKEQKLAMKIALHNFNNNSQLHKLSLHFRNSGGDPIRSAHAAEELIKEKLVEVIMGMETWEEAALVADIGSRAQVPVLSFAAAAITPPLMQLRWPFLVQMVTDGSEQMNCIADVVQSFSRQSVVAIYEEDIHGGDPGKLTLLYKALKNVGSDIAYHLVLPPFSALSKLNPHEFVNKELSKLENNTKSRLFIFLQSSLQLTNLLFSEAKKMRFMQKESVWIIADTTSSLLNSVSPPVVFAMEGALVIKPYYSENSNSFKYFSEQFRQKFQSAYPEEDKYEPGIHALGAYDSIMTLTQAMMKTDGKMSSSNMLRDSILSSNFTGLSGEVRFQEGRLSSSQKFSIVNIANQEYKNLGFWSSESGFSDSIAGTRKFGNVKELGGFAEVIWPGDPERIPGGMAPMKIAVPGRGSFKEFLKAESDEKSEKYFTGFCINVYKEVQIILEHSYNIHLPSPIEFYEYDGSYDDLVESVQNKTFDAAVGDITILAERWNKVEFTQPFIESGLLMVVPVKPETSKAWLFLKPFTMEMWVATACILIYTMFIVWSLEQRSNPEFSGPWKESLGNVLWFTFSTLFFAHREKIKSNYTRTVVVVWLFVVLILTQSFTASLTSMLTVSRLRPTVTDIELLKRTHATVGCDGPTFVRDYLEQKYEFEPGNILNISSESEYLSAFENGTIQAAFLEFPYAKVFVNQYCKHYEYGDGSFTRRFGGFGFVFQKGSGLAAIVSEAILKLSENGRLKELEKVLFTPSSECSNSQTTNDNYSLSIQGFLGLYLISAGTSTICLLLYLLKTRFLTNPEPTSSSNIPQIELVTTPGAHG
ncbi:glutamate receptor 2.7-like [Cornus florida]|uniref:glutamate receptor 2.7-like n=1 Tax=Cornus florida TaxID=4283 RepID=UPI0028A13BF5|nr:glutamate receptor 2.7-like [Cornus florida]